jgi:hypothetical protein
MKTKMSIEELERSFLRFDDLDSLTSTTNIQSVESALVRKSPSIVFIIFFG